MRKRSFPDHSANDSAPSIDTSEMQNRQIQEIAPAAEQSADVFRYAWLAIDLVGAEMPKLIPAGHAHLTFDLLS